MKKNIILLVLGIITFSAIQKSHGQTLDKIFLMLPDSVTMWKSKADARLMLDCYLSDDFQKQLDNRVYTRIEDLDRANGYMCVSGAASFWEMCYWNLDDKITRFVAVTHGWCGPVCGTVELVFYFYFEDKLLLVDKSTVVPDIWAALYKKPYTDEELNYIGNKLMLAPLVYKLPQKGLNITVYFELWHDVNKMKAYFHGNSVELIWDNGKFNIGEIKWDITKKGYGY